MTSSQQSRDHEQDIVYPATIPFVLVHLACLGVLWSGVTVEAVVLCVGLYAARMFAVTAGYHRYFSHRSFKTSRVGQFLLAVACQTSAQRGVVWWAAKHRAHHKYSDTDRDPHSPLQRGFWFAHVGWIFAPSTLEADYRLVPDLTKYPELMWLDRQKYLPAMLLGIATSLVAGWPGFFVGFLLSTVFLYHGSFAINSLAHLWGKRRYVTGDDSRNSLLLAVLTFGEGWHNNHHYYQSSTRQGFFWWEIDVTYYLLQLLSAFGVVWDLRAPPAAVLAGAQRPRAAVVETVARQLAESFPLERISHQVKDVWSRTLSRADLVRLAHEMKTQAQGAVMDIHLPHIPTLDELRARALEMFSHTPALEEIVQRSRQVLMETVWARAMEASLAPA